MRGLRFALGVGIAVACCAAPVLVRAQAAPDEPTPSTATTDEEESAGVTPAVDAGALGLTMSGDGGRAALDELVVEAKKPLSAASAQEIRARDFELRPHATTQEVLQNVPGLVVSQHQGGGKAMQYLIRGFDADHGTDFAIFVDGVPVNLVSHAHGQGYADMNFVIPETIRDLKLWKGPYFTQFGDFENAGRARGADARRGRGELVSRRGRVVRHRALPLPGVAAARRRQDLPRGAGVHVERTVHQSGQLLGVQLLREVHARPDADLDAARVGDRLRRRLGRVGRDPAARRRRHVSRRAAVHRPAPRPLRRDRSDRGRRHRLRGS